MKIISITACGSLENINDSISYVGGHFYKEYECTWKKPNGTEYKKFLKNKPTDSYFENLPIGSYNQYGHKLLNIETCYLSTWGR